MQANPVAATATDYVYALEQGAQLKTGVEWTFVEGGQKVTYVIDENTPYIVEKGHVYTLTTEDGKVISYNRRLHCVLLVGYDDDYYYGDYAENVDGY